jgi:hypothetical protein
LAAILRAWRLLNVEQLRRASEAYNRGDVEPLVVLLDEDVDWYGRMRGHLWWKRTPSCHGPGEARANFELRLRKRRFARVMRA